MHIQRQTHTRTHVQSAHKRNGDNQAQEPGWEGRKEGFVRDLAHTKKKCQEKPIFTNLKKRFEHIELPAKLLDYFLRSNEEIKATSINPCASRWERSSSQLKMFLPFVQQQSSNITRTPTCKTEWARHAQTRAWHTLTMSLWCDALRASDHVSWGLGASHVSAILRTLTPNICLSSFWPLLLPLLVLSYWTQLLFCLLFRVLWPVPFSRENTQSQTLRLIWLNWSCKSIPGPLYYCAPLVCVNKFLGGLAVWNLIKPKPKRSYTQLRNNN